MEINTTEFVGSFPKTSLCPTDGRAELAFIGRSNVGKSSLINMLTGKKGLAKVSQTPGKTQLLNFFLINHFWYLVDLPGYGYAKVSKVKQKVLSGMIKSYLFQREALLIAFVLIDPNIPPTKIDLEFINGLGEGNVPFALVFTKTDKMGKVAVQQSVDRFLAALSETWETLPPHFVTSSEYRTGRPEMLEYIDGLLKRHKPPTKA
ncbi:MAG: ribosome biogenesis GTP-binding protein YihA/YsxC [Saprospiraceae bacterium]|nr:ribosome biogenesis GTP-binding protein YihA/YsxC [Saprospiraceae bacterium]